jgi:3-hydroxyisobutyrate dehydrogenase-like beta-hydroxyacid dehydrogenase
MDGGTTTVSVIGLGNMGSALADAPIAKGFDVTVWNRTPAKAERFAKAGQAVARTPAAAAAASDVVVVCLFDHAANRDVVLTDGVAGAMRGKPLVQMSHVGTEGLAELEAWAGRHGIPVLKGLIFVYPDDIRRGEGTVVYGGPRVLFDSLRPLLDAMGGRPVHAGEALGAGATLGAAYCCFLYPALLGFLHGAAMCHRSGIAIEDFTKDVIMPFPRGRSFAGMLEGLMRASASRRYTGDLQATLDAWYHDLELALDGVTATGVSTALMAAVRDRFNVARARGFGGQDVAAIFETLVEGANPGAD